MTLEDASSLADLFLKRVDASPDAVAYRFPVGEAEWGELSWKQCKERVRAIAGGLREVGVEMEQRVTILSGTRIEWILADLGSLCTGAATTTIYPSSMAPDCQYILTDSQSVVAFVEDAAQVEKLVACREQLSGLRKVVVFDGPGGHDGWVISLAELEDIGREHDAKDPAEFERRAQTITPQHLATLIYTSGTTGKPKGVELTHDSWIYNGRAVEALHMLSQEDHQYLWLPLSHVLGKVLIVCPIQIGFPTSVDGRVERLVENLAVVRPTWMGAPPRIFEKVYNKVVMAAKDGGPLRYGIFRWALAVGHQVSKLTQQGERPGGMLALKHRIADALVFAKLRERFGGRIRFMISGSAPLSRAMAEFFHAAGILILEGYGSTESGAGSFLSRLDSYAFGMVGLPLPGTEVKLAPEDNEVLLKSRANMRGYHNLPEANEAVFTEDGWLRTGDIGELDELGRLRITDRKHDLIKTSGGKYVAPQKLEAQLKAQCPYVGHVVVHGDRRNFCSALIALDPEAMEKWAEDHGARGHSYSEITKNPEVQRMVQQAVDSTNTELARHETIKRFAVLPEDLTIDNGLLTPSMKVRRKLVETRYKQVLDDFYEGALSAT